MATYFPLLTKTLVDYLLTTEPQAALANCFVASEIPNPRPQRYIQLLAIPTGGPQRAGILATRRISAQVDEASDFLAGTLTETVCGLLVDTKYQGLGIKSVNVIGSPGSFPGPGQPHRWQLTADFLIRAKASVL